MAKPYGTQNQMEVLFGCSADNVGLHLKNIYAIGELAREAAAEEFPVVRMEGVSRVRRRGTGCNLDDIISVGYRGNSVLGVNFRQWATGGLKDCLLRGYAIDQRMDQLEDKFNRGLPRQEADIAGLKEKGEFFVPTQEVWAGNWGLRGERGDVRIQIASCRMCMPCRCHCSSLFRYASSSCWRRRRGWCMGEFPCRLSVGNYHRHIAWNKAFHP